MVRPELSELQQIKKSGCYKTAPVSMEILSDLKTPIEVLKILQNVSGHCYEPSLEITCQNGHMSVGALTFETTDPGKYIRQVIEQHKSPRLPYLPTFTGGLVGYFSYDYLKYAEPSLRLNAADTEGFLPPSAA